MCGIVGIYCTDNQAEIDINRDSYIINNMLDVINHRGPDARATYLDSKILLGFNRLSIIDIENGMQPMHSHDYKLTIVCNGEIFNYIELREELKKDGFSFKTNSDIEVLLPLYQKYQYDFLNKINGQFALALYDRDKEILLIARDHFGICPLFFTKVDNKVVIASEIKALLKYPGIDANLDLVGLDQLLTFPGVISPRTMFKNINSVEAGKFYIFSKKNDVKSIQYWDYNFPKETARTGYNYKDYLAQLENKLLKAVNIRTRADVPVGMYLSGGLDSTLILSFLKKILKKNEVIKTFSIDFFDDILSEKYFQDIAANYYKTQQNNFSMGPQEIISRLNRVIFHSETPLKETFNTSALALSEMAHAQGLKVVLAGQGADELFAGYVGYLFDSMPNVRQKNINENEKKLQKKIWGSEDFIYEKLYKQYEITKSDLYSKQLVENFHEFNCLNYPIINSSNVIGKSKLARRSYIDLKLRLAEHLLSDHGDRMAMANSIEVRYPFLDREVVELAVMMPDQLKLNNLIVKYILKELAKKYIPQEIVDREKQGFAAGGSPYLLQNKNEYIQDLLSYSNIKKHNIFNPDFVEKLKLKYSEPGFKVKVPFDNDLLMPIITYTIWHETFNVKSL